MDHQTGHWFIVATCEKCRTTIYLFRDLNEGKGSLNATYKTTCPNCHYTGYYDGRHYQEPFKSASSSNSR